MKRRKNRLFPFIILLAAILVVFSGCSPSDDNIIPDIVRDMSAESETPAFSTEDAVNGAESIQTTQADVPSQDETSDTENDNPEPIAEPETPESAEVIEEETDNSAGDETVPSGDAEEDPSEELLPGAPSSEEAMPEKESIPDNSSFEIRFIDVGQGDASLVLCDGHAMLIDGGDRNCSSLIYAVLKNNKVDFLDYMVATHPDADHVGGLAGALNYASVGTAFCTTDTHDTETFGDFKKYLAKQNVGITIPKAGDSFYLGSAKVTVLAPAYGQLSDNTSIILRIEYGETSFLFTGDAEYEDEKALVDSGMDFESTVLKVAHHGSDSSSCYSFLYCANPQYCVISAGGNNSYGHPTENVLSRIRDLGAQLYRTDINGDIICTSDSHKVTFTLSKNQSVDTFAFAGGYANCLAKQQALQQQEAAAKEQEQTKEPEEQSAGNTYMVNLNSKKFHYPNCASVSKMAEKNKWLYEGTREWLIENGYDPCKNCNP